jgi:hypothetical protein
MQTREVTFDSTLLLDEDYDAPVRVHATAYLPDPGETAPARAEIDSVSVLEGRMRETDATPYVSDLDRLDLEQEALEAAAFEVLAERPKPDAPDTVELYWMGPRMMGRSCPIEY